MDTRSPRHYLDRLQSTGWAGNERRSSLLGAKPHPLGKLKNDLFAQVCDRLNQIIQL